MAKKNDNLKPFLKWAGGKRQLLPHLKKYIPNNFNRYFEPFIGGGALFFSTRPPLATINDLNFELCNCYNVIKNNLEKLINYLKKHKNNKEYYYEIRDLDRKKNYLRLSKVRRAARIIYLNKTCYNGLFRVNSQGNFNVPFGNYKNPKILNEEVLRDVSKYLNENNIKILNTDFEQALKDVQKGDFVYLDPPYDPISDTSSFTGYSLQGFSRKEQIRLKNCFDNLHNIGCRLMLSNSSTPFIREIYSQYNIITVKAKRAINSIATKRGKIDEVIILNYD